MQNQEVTSDATRSSDDFVTATLYVLNDLPADEVDQFEQRLANEQSLRELVAQAVGVTQAIASDVKQVQLATTNQGSPSSVVRMWALAASLLLVASASIAVVWNQSVTNMTAQKQSDSIRLAQAWVEESIAQTEQDSTDWEESLELMDTEQATEDSLLAEDLATPPSWMLQALTSTTPSSASMQ